MSVHERFKRCVVLTMQAQISWRVYLITEAFQMFPAAMMDIYVWWCFYLRLMTFAIIVNDFLQKLQLNEYLMHLLTFTAWSLLFYFYSCCSNRGGHLGLLVMTLSLFILSFTVRWAMIRYNQWQWIFSKSFIEKMYIQKYKIFQTTSYL